MKILAIAGAPGVGKTTLVLKLRQLLGCYQPAKDGLLEYESFADSGVVVLGRYVEGEVFGGTDRLSMAVQPDAERYVARISEEGSISVVFEGDRLCTSSFVRDIRSKGDFRLIILKTKPEILVERRADRSFEVGKGQNETWLKGRESKVANLESSFHGESHYINTMDDSATLAGHLYAWLMGQEERPKNASRTLF